MARFTAGGDEGGNERRPSNNRPFPKRPRLSNPSSNTPRRPNAAAVSTSNSPDRANASTSAAPQPPVEIEVQPEEPVAAAEESEVESVEESDTSWSDSSSGSEEESDEQEEEELNQRSGDEVQPTETQVDSTPNGNGTFPVSEEPRGPVSATLMDPDVLDCPICYEPLCSPVYQCENGHIACASCCTRMRNKCANCRRPIGYNRCRGIEKVLESVRITCRNMPHGCMETLNYSKKLAHEKTCNYAPCSCPHIGCNYVGMSKCLYTHFALLHSHSSKQFLFNSVISISLDNNQMHVFLQERSQSILFILNRSIESLGSIVNVICVAPTSAKKAFLYDLTATVGESSIRLKSCAECMPKWTAQASAKKYLLVHSDFININGQLRLELIIWRDPALAS
ncbi:hypothetical protein Pfo_008476 [Paulownia fortunei]|nr:hypothetical protein Pfo_008476 [Paulownia fortunei]